MILSPRGFAQLLPLEALHDPSNGCLVDDSCIFGAKFLSQNQLTTGNLLSLLHRPNIRNATFRWKIESFSDLNRESHKSEDFTAGKMDWSAFSMSVSFRLCSNSLHSCNL